MSSNKPTKLNVDQGCVLFKLLALDGKILHTFKVTNVYHRIDTHYN